MSHAPAARERSQLVQARGADGPYGADMQTLRIFQLVSWISLPTVMFGGYSLLGAAGDKLTEAQRALFRAGHAHAGVLLLLSLGYELTIAGLPIADAAKTIGCAALLAGVLMQSGGFFWRAFVGDAGKTVTRVGALLLAAAHIVLIWGLFTS